MHLLTINTGSSSLKAALYAIEERRACRALVVHLARIGQGEGPITIADAAGRTLIDERCDLPEHAAAQATLFGCLREIP